MTRLNIFVMLQLLSCRAWSGTHFTAVV